MSVNLTVINPTVAAGDRDASVWLELTPDALVLRFSRAGRQFELPLVTLPDATVAKGAEQNLATVLKELQS